MIMRSFGFLNSRWLSLSLRWIATSALAIPIAWGIAGETTDPLGKSLDEMRAIEAQIQSKLRVQAATETRIKDADQTLKLTEEFMRGNEKVRVQGPRTLRAFQDSLDRNRAAMDQAVQSSRRQLDSARAGMELTAPLTLHVAKTEGATDHRALTLALLQEHRRDQAKEAVEQALRLDELRNSNQNRQGDIDAQIQRYADLGNLSLDQLRRRHRELSKNLDRLHAESVGGKKEIASLSARRKALDDLIMGLADGTIDPAAVKKDEARRVRGELEKEKEKDKRGTEGRKIAKIQESPATPLSAPQPPPAPGDLPEVPNEDQTQLALGTRQGAGAPTMKLDIASQNREGEQNETRRIFWRASSSRVCAFASGKVLFSGAFAGYRHLLILDLSDNWTAIFGNLTSCELMEGDTLTAGRVLGFYKTPEGEDAEPLWIEVRKSGKPVAIETCPSAGAAWLSRVFGEGAR